MANNWSATLTPKGAMKRVLKQMKDIEQLIQGGKLVDWAGELVPAMVVQRTIKGYDNRDRKFEGYSDSYASQWKGGRKQPVTLVKDGEMVDLVDFKKTGPRSGKVYVRTGGNPNREAIAAAHYRGAGWLPQRMWLGMSPSDMKILNRETLLWLERRLNLQGPGLRKTGSRAFKPKGKKVWTVKNPVPTVTV